MSLEPLILIVEDEEAIHSFIEEWPSQKREKMAFQWPRLMSRMIYGLGGMTAPFVGIKLIDLVVTPLLTALGM